MSYIVPRERPKTCDECSFSAYSPQYNSLRCMLSENILLVKRDARYAFCPLIDIENGPLFDKERARKYLGTNLPANSPVIREATE